MTTQRTLGEVVGINGYMATVRFDTHVIQNEVAFVLGAGTRLKSEVIRVRGDLADLQVFESTAGVKAGDKVEFSGELLSVVLGPGLLAQVYDGLQNPLPALAREAGSRWTMPRRGSSRPRSRLATPCAPAIRWARCPRGFSSIASWCRLAGSARGR